MPAAERFAIIMEGMQRSCDDEQTAENRRAPRAVAESALRASVVLAVLVVSTSGCRHSAAANEHERKDADVRVRVEPAAERTLAEKVTGLGRCEAVPEHFAVLTAAAEGRVIGLLKRPGDEVKRGDAVVQLDSTVAERSLVEKQRALESQKLAIDQAEVALKKARLATERLRALRKRGEISESAMSETETAERQADLQLQSAKAQYKMAEAAVATATAQLAQLTIRTPIAGTLNSLNCQLGQTLSVGTSVGEVVDAAQLQAVVWIAVADARRMKPKQAVTVHACGSSMDDAAESDAAGAVLDVGKVADPQTGNLPVRFKIDNAAGHLTVGEAVMAAVVLREERVIAVPNEAVRYSSDEDAAREGKADLVVVREGKAAILHPKLGLKDRGWVAVGDIDLRPGEPVVVEGGYNLPKDTKVEIERDALVVPPSGGKENDDRLKPGLRTAESEK
jgi:RND family efflux transporter MFP subunit